MSKPLRDPIYVPFKKIGWWRHMKEYIYVRYNKRFAPFILDLLTAFERNEIKKGHKKPYGGNDEG